MPDLHGNYQLAKMPVQRIKAGFRNIRESLLQYPYQGSRRALHGARTFGRQGQFNRSLILLHSGARNQSQRFEPPDQIARSGLVNGKRPRKLPNFRPGPPGDVGERPKLRSAHSGLVLDLFVVAPDRLDQYAELLQHFQHLCLPVGGYRPRSALPTLRFPLAGGGRYLHHHPIHARNDRYDEYQQRKQQVSHQLSIRDVASERPGRACRQTVDGIFKTRQVTFAGMYLMQSYRTAFTRARSGNLVLGRTFRTSEEVRCRMFIPHGTA